MSWVANLLLPKGKELLSHSFELTTSLSCEATSLLSVNIPLTDLSGFLSLCLPQTMTLRTQDLSHAG